MAPTRKERKAGERKNAEPPKPAPAENSEALKTLEAQVASFGKNIEGLRGRIGALEIDKGIKEIELKNLRELNIVLCQRTKLSEQKEKELARKYTELDVEHKDLQQRHKSLKKKVPTSNIFNPQPPAPPITNPFQPPPRFSFTIKNTMADQDFEETIRMHLENEEENKKLEAIYDQLDGLKTQNKHLTEHANRNEKYKVQYESLQQWATTLEQQEFETKQSLKAEKETSRHLQATIDTLKKVEEAAGDEHQVQEQKIARLENQVKLRDSDIDDARARSKTAEAQLKEKNDAYDRLHVNLSDASTLVRETEARAQELQSSLKNSIAHHNDDLAKWETERLQKEFEIDELKQQIEFKNSMDEIGRTDPTTKAHQRRNSKERTLFDDLEGNDADDDDFEHDVEHEAEHEVEHEVEGEIEQKSGAVEGGSSYPYDIPPIDVPLPDSPLLPPPPPPTAPTAPPAPPAPPAPEPVIVERWRERNVRYSSAINTNPLLAWLLVYKNMLILALEFFHYFNGTSARIRIDPPRRTVKGAMVVTSINESGELVKTTTERNGDVTIEIQEKASRPEVFSTLLFFASHVLVYSYIYLCWRETNRWLTVNGIPQRYPQSGFGVRYVAHAIGEFLCRVYQFLKNTKYWLKLDMKKHTIDFAEWVYDFEKKHFGEINRGVLG
ncbi:hypothetical protein BP6252_11649 [Coleophoma cylindrospora]|uniref:Uncharacterized protein n=1 Tax=Coleophoma cylindrospora TaxID=1849047 RepID=A0A3D8QK63_9HELO|nr:hypothetical protein BP6252_11649 [Coleophoma cylindrospora]